MQAVVALGINTNFLIAILVCLAIIVILVIAMAVYRRRRNVFGYVVNRLHDIKFIIVHVGASCTVKLFSPSEIFKRIALVAYIKTSHILQR